MSVHLRLRVGPLVLVDALLFDVETDSEPDDEPPAQLAGGSGTVMYPEPIADVETFGFTT